MNELAKAVEALTDTAIFAIFFSIPLVMGIISLMIGN
jgi:hypothetical protein